MPGTRAATPVPSRILRTGSAFIAAGLVGTLALMVVPIPTMLLDLLLTFNLGLSLVVLLLAMYTGHPLEFSAFPSLLLMLTLYRLGLNVASTRLVLTQADAGAVIAAFGDFVVGGSYVVGIIIFLVINVIQFVVITRGAGRIAEVAARFTLDAMPGKQMAIDADVNAGLITEEEARRRRQRVSREAEFYGSMDGASKFVRGDAIAGIVIVAINILGGFAIGVLQRGMSVQDALRAYTQLTIGDGLVNQIPALIISTAAGIMVTRAGSEADLGHDLLGQLLTQPRALLIAAGTLGLFGLIPGLPFLPFFLLAAALALAGRGLRNAGRLRMLEDAKAVVKPRPTPHEEVGELLEVDPLELEIGYGLIGLVETSLGGDLLDRISMVRRQLAGDLGIVVPPIRIRDNTRLRVNEYVVKLRGVEVARAELQPQGYLAMGTGTAREPLRGTAVTEPVFGLPAVWVGPEDKLAAEAGGYTVIEPAAVLATHLTETLRRAAPELLTRQDVHQLVEGVKRSSPAVVEELIPAKLGLGAVQKVLQLLLREGVSIRDLTSILETLADCAPATREPELLAERVRQSLGRTLARQHTGTGNRLFALTLDPALEDEIRRESRGTEGGAGGALRPERVRDLAESVAREIQRAGGRGQPPVLLVHPEIRTTIRRLLEPTLPRLPVLSYAEVQPPVEAVSLGSVRTRNAA